MTQRSVAGQRSTKRSPTPIRLENTISDVTVIHDPALGKHASKAYMDNICSPQFPETIFHWCCEGNGLDNDKAKQETKKYLDTIVFVRLMFE